jgi:dihydrofolate reductase
VTEFIFYAAVSSDGFIAGPEGDMAWAEKYLTGGDDYGFFELMSSCSAVMMGAETFDFELQAIGNEPRMLPTFVLTTNPHRFDGITDKNIHFLGGDIAEVAKTVHEKISSITGDSNSLVFVFGGASVVKQMLAANRLDVVRLFVTPDVLGGGVPLFDLTGESDAPANTTEPEASGNDPIKAALSNFTQVNQRGFSSGLVEKIFARN